MRFKREHCDRRKRDRCGTSSVDGSERLADKIAGRTNLCGVTRRASGYCLIGQAMDGTRRRLLSGIVSRRLAARIRLLMTESVAYADLQRISIEREQSVPDRTHVTPDSRASNTHFSRHLIVRGFQPV